jgi:hypothetical protein
MTVTPQKLTTTLKYQHFAVVAVEGEFPIDALRYDRCFPFGEQDSREIMESQNYSVPGTPKRYIVICKFSESTKNPWFEQFWISQSRVNLYPIDGSQVVTLRDIAKEESNIHLALNRPMDDVHEELRPAYRDLKNVLKIGNDVFQQITVQQWLDRNLQPLRNRR